MARFIAGIPQPGIRLRPRGVNSGVSQIALALNGRTLVARDQAGVVHLWDWATGTHLRKLEMNKRHEFAVTPDGRYLLLSKDDHEDSHLIWFDIERNEYVSRFTKDEGDSHGKDYHSRWKETGDGRSLESRSANVGTSNQVRQGKRIPSVVTTP